MQAAALLGLLLFAVGALAGTVLNRHDEVVAMSSGELCDRIDSFVFSHCYHLSTGALLPAPASIPTAPLGSGGCFGFCTRGDLPRAAGVPEMDVWSNRACDVMALNVGGRLSATPTGFALLAAPALAIVSTCLLTLALARFRRSRPVRRAARIAVGGGYTAIAVAPLAIIVHAFGPIWLLAGIAVVAVTLVITVIGLLAARWQRSAAGAWMEPAAAAAQFTVLLAAAAESGTLFGC